MHGERLIEALLPWALAVVGGVGIILIYRGGIFSESVRAVVAYAAILHQ